MQKLMSARVINLTLSDRLKVLGCVLFLSCFQLSAQDFVSPVNMWIERGEDKTAWGINLIIENPSTVDTVIARSTFFIDEYSPLNRIFINCCRRMDSTDSIRCRTGYLHKILSGGRGNRITVSISDEIAVRILPESQVVLNVPVSPHCRGSEIFLEIRMVYSTGRLEDASFLTKRTNKILFERLPTVHEEFQRRRSIERANERRNRQKEKQE